MNNDAKQVPIKRFSVEEIAKLYHVPYWLIDGVRPSWLARPIWRARAWWWIHRWDRSDYNGQREFENGIVWWRFTSGPFVGWGIWRRDASAEVLHEATPGVPCIWVGNIRGRNVWILKPEAHDAA